MVCDVCVQRDLSSPTQVSLVCVSESLVCVFVVVCICVCVGCVCVGWGTAPGAGGTQV